MRLTSTSSSAGRRSTLYSPVFLFCARYWLKATGAKSAAKRSSLTRRMFSSSAAGRSVARREQVVRDRDVDVLERIAARVVAVLVGARVGAAFVLAFSSNQTLPVASRAVTSSLR